MYIWYNVVAAHKGTGDLREKKSVVALWLCRQGSQPLQEANLLSSNAHNEYRWLWVVVSTNSLMTPKRHPQSRTTITHESTQPIEIYTIRPQSWYPLLLWSANATADKNQLEGTHLQSFHTHCGLLRSTWDVETNWWLFHYTLTLTLSLSLSLSLPPPSLFTQSNIDSPKFSFS